MWNQESEEKKLKKMMARCLYSHTRRGCQTGHGSLTIEDSITEWIRKVN